MDEAVNYIKNGKKAAGVDEIFVPGEKSAMSEKKAMVEGIVYPMEVINECNAQAEKYGLPLSVRL